MPAHRPEVVSTPITERRSSAMPRNGFPLTIGEYPMTGAGVERRAARMPPTASAAPMLTTGLEGQRHDVGTGDRVDDPGPFAVSAPMNAKLCGDLGSVANPPLLEVDRLAIAGVGIGDDDVGLASVVAGAGSSVAEATTGRTGPRSPATADGGTQHLAADEVGRQIDRPVRNQSGCTP